MKNNVIMFMIVCIILLLLNLIEGIQGTILFIGIFIVLLLALISIAKKHTLFLAYSLIYCFFLIYYLIYQFNFFSILTTIILIIYYIYCFKYLFNLINNKMNIQFKNIKIPEDNEYLIVKYLKGPIKSINYFGIIVRQKDSFVLTIENEKGQIEDFDILTNDIESVSVEEKPYKKDINAITGYNIDISRSYFSGRVRGDIETAKSFKFIKSYEIEIELKNKEKIKLLSFDSPDIFK